jgi:hypothetical protein
MTSVGEVHGENLILASPSIPADERIAFARRYFFTCALFIERNLYLSLLPSPAEIALLSDSWPIERGPHESWTPERRRCLDRWLELRGHASLSECIATWQRRFQLPDDWCANTAMETMNRYWPWLELTDDHQFFAHGVLQVPPEPPTEWEIKLALPDRWLPWYESREAFEARVREALAKQLDNSEVHVPRSKKLVHFYWLVLHTVCRKSTYEIAEQMWPGFYRSATLGKRSDKAKVIQKGVATTAELIGLTLPPDPRRKKRVMRTQRAPI